MKRARVSWTDALGYDANGNTLSDPSGKSYTWDFENRLTQAVNPGVGTTTFKYDPFGRRIQKSGPLGTTNYLYDGPNLLEQVDNSGNVLGRYSGGPWIDETLSQLQSAASSYYEQDGLGSVTSLSNAAGALANTYTYDSFGKLIASTNWELTGDRRDVPHFFSRSRNTPTQKHSISAETDSLSDIFLRMARSPRVVVDVPHHVTQRGNARQVILAGDADRLTYMALLRRIRPALFFPQRSTQNSQFL